MSQVLRREVLASFKNLHKARKKVFADDVYALERGRERINEEFKKNKHVTDPTAIRELTKFADGVSEELLTTVVQAVEVSPGTYDMKPVTVKGKPLEVGFCMTIIDINSIDVENMDFRMDMLLHEQWEDPRLDVPEEFFENDDEYVTLPAQVCNELWQPDLYFLNSKVVEIATLTKEYASMTVFKNKTVRYMARMHAVVACQMEFQYYPMDTQICPVNIESFSYDNTKMVLKWLYPNVQVSPELKLLQYKLGKLRTLQKHVVSREKAGNFSRLVVYFRFDREIGHHMIMTFAPSTLVVILSWFSFWLGLDAVPARVTLLVTCLLTLVTMFAAQRSETPPVAYIKCLDIWMSMCKFFVFSALGEFVIIKVMHERYKVTQWQQKVAGLDTKRDEYPDFDSYSRFHWTDSMGKHRIVWVEIDMASRIFFPVFFLFFILTYFPLLIFHTRY